jgi:hypothetical protein
MAAQFSRGRPTAGAQSARRLLEDAATRYQDLKRRSKQLRKGWRRVKWQMTRDNPLRAVGFTAPLSLAGEDSRCVVRAEGLAQVGTPIALDYDAQGRHRGTPIGEVIAKLEARFRRAWTVAEVLSAYEQLMRSCRLDALSSHTLTRYRKLPDLVARNRAERRRLKDLLDAATAAESLDVDSEEVRFSVVLDPNALHKALNGIDDGTDSAVVVGYHPQRGLHFDGRPVVTRAGMGGGFAVVHRHDLVALLQESCGDDGHRVELECHPDHWVGFILDEHGDPVGHWRRRYFDS